MQVSRDEKGGHALMALTIDSVVPPAVLGAITEEIGAHTGRAVDLEG
jgi:D-3-phosphoglycerate dehydrogenase